MKIILIAIWVDDGIIAASTQKLVDETLSSLREEYKMSSTGEVDWFLGTKIDIDQKVGKLTVTSEKYLMDIVSKFGQQDCKGKDTPSQPGMYLTKHTSTDEERNRMENVPFAEVCGSLLYAVNTRPDIAYSVHNICRHMQNVHPSHWTAAKRIVAYLKKHPKLGMTYERKNDPRERLELIGYSDSDFAQDPISRKSTTGYVIYLGGSVVAFKTKLQPIVTLSSTGAEFVAGCACAKEMMSIKHLLDDIGIPLTSTPVLKMDNTSAATIAGKPTFSGRSKHLEVRYFYLKQLVQEGLLDIQYVQTTDNIADFFTKPLARVVFERLREALVQ